MIWVEAVRLTHYARGDTFRKRNNAIGLAAVTLSTVVSAGILTSIHNRPGFWWTVAGAAVALSAALLTGIRSYLKLDKLSESHRKAGAKFGEVYRDLELFVLGNPANDASTRDALSRIAEDIGKLEEVGPGYPSKVFEKKYDKVKRPDRDRTA
jgi:outer membrane murein-binding lipoprotein Lpp